MAATLDEARDTHSSLLDFSQLRVRWKKERRIAMRRWRCERGEESACVSEWLGSLRVSK